MTPKNELDCPKCGRPTNDHRYDGMPWTELKLFLMSKPACGMRRHEIIEWFKDN